MAEQLQDLEDYIQYQFDDIPSFKLAVFLNSEEIKVKTVVGEVEENLISTLISSVHDHQTPENFHLGSHIFSKDTLKSNEKLLEYSSESDSPRVFVVKRNDNLLIVYCCGTSCEKDQGRVRELMLELLY
ncbi:hypothetical protein GCK72_003380 [Caenorhabditis remanei]|uniref:Profilin n=1 Tax=Caenorhabditis remanei TaxID=31234 RepID=A0A6A5HY55_CAERE|nr:hypothetical protein GCK72_003380 [Caenorhabditis remanei]KAF1771553.1 hypothetical protein GCK72_003380 [Caenorhabditis remanei]